MGGSGEAQASRPADERIDFTLERGRHRRFVGREDVLARLDAWLLGPDDTGWVVVTGGPGMGKSAILSKWLDRREAAGAAVPHHFVRRQVIDWDQPERISASLAAQIEAVFPEQRDARAKPEGRLPELLGRVSKHLGASGRLVIVVDGLDETRAEPGENPLPRFLPHVAPAGIRILCATRPTYPHLGWIEARSPARRMNLDDDQWASSNEAVVRGFWEAVGPDYQPPLPASTVAAAIARAEGNVLHAVMLHDVLRDLPPEQRRAERIPGGLRHLIGEVWDRAADEQRDDLALPHVGQWVDAGTPPPRSLGLRRQRSLLPLPCRPLAHPGGCSCCLLLLFFHELLPQQPDLLVGDHRPRVGPMGLTSLQDGLGDRHE